MIKNCPLCEASFVAAPIPDIYFVHYMEDDPNWDRSKHRSHEQQVREWNDWLAKQGRPPEDRCFCLPYGEKAPEDRFFSNLCGVEVPGVYDGTLFWRCPSCCGDFHRWPEGHELRRIAEKYMNQPQPA